MNYSSIIDHVGCALLLKIADARPLFFVGGELWVGYYREGKGGKERGGSMG